MDTFDPAARSEIMRRVLSENTTPEMKVRRALHAAGLRFRLHRKGLPGKPDLVLPKHKVALFVHGCFWHWHGCKRSRMPQDNRDYWTAKIDRNVERDKVNRARLEQLGWRVRIVWECSVAKEVAEIIEELDAKTPNSSQQP